MSSNNKSITQKSIISIVILSVITGGIIALQAHFNKGYVAEKNHTEQVNNHASIEIISLAEPEKIAVHAQSKLISEAAIAEPLDQMSLPSKEIVLFALGSAQIKPDYFTALSATAKQIKISVKDEQIVWQIVGHSDHSGTAQFNLKLAKQRAQAVADFLLDKGVEQAQLSVISLGESFPVTLDPIRTSNPLDRRVEIHLYQAEIATLAKQLNRAIKPAAQHHKKFEQLKAPRAEQLIDQVDEQVADQVIPSMFAASVLATRGVAFEQQQAFVKTSAVIQF